MELAGITAHRGGTTYSSVKCLLFGACANYMGRLRCLQQNTPALILYPNRTTAARPDGVLNGTKSCALLVAAVLSNTLILLR